MNNYPFEPEKQAPYEPYQPTVPATPPPPPPSYQSTDPYTPSQMYGLMDPYASSSQPPPYQSVYPYVVPQPVKPRGRRSRTLFIGIASLVALLIVVGAIAVLATRGATGVSPTPTLASVHYPSVASAYSGTTHNASSNLDANIAMTSVVQDKDKINGDMRVGLPLIGSGPFTGTISSSGVVQFTSTSKDNGNTSITFNGLIAMGGSMSGTYTVTSNGQSGTWKAIPTANPVVYPMLSQNYSGNFTNTATGKSGVLSLQIITQNQQNFTGVAFTVLPINGTVGSDNSIQFTGTDSKGVTFKFTGTVNTDGSLSGNYTASAGGVGTWKVSRA